MRHDHLDAEEFLERLNVFDRDFTGVQNNFQTQIFHAHAGFADAELEHLLIKGAKETENLRFDRGNMLIKLRLVPVTGGVKENGVAFQLDQLQRRQRGFNDRLQQLDDDLFGVGEGNGVQFHEFRETADIGKN